VVWVVENCQLRKKLFEKGVQEGWNSLTPLAVAQRTWNISSIGSLYPNSNTQRTPGTLWISATMVSITVVLNWSWDPEFLLYSM